MEHHRNTINISDIINLNKNIGEAGDTIVTATTKNIFLQIQVDNLVQHNYQNCNVLYHYNFELINI